MSDPAHGESEDALLRRAQAGDDEALGALLQRWQPSLEGIARSLHRRNARLGFDTHDLVATTIRRLLRIGPGNVREAAGRALLRRILRGAYVDKVRDEVSRRRRQAEAIRSAPASRPDAAPRDVPGEMHADEWELILLWKQGLSWAQIGAHLAIPPETARRRWHRLMARLRNRRAARPEGGRERTVASDPESAPEETRAEDRSSDRVEDRDRPPGPPG